MSGYYTKMLCHLVCPKLFPKPLRIQPIMYDTDVEKTMEGLTDVKKTLAFNITDQNLFRISIAEECMGKQTGFAYVDVPKDDVLLLQELLPQAVDLMLKNARETTTMCSG